MWTASLLLWASASYAAPSVGPIDLATWRGHTYAFIDQYLDHEGAKEACALLDARLVTVDDASEFWYLHGRLHGGPRYNHSGWSWVGAARIAPDLRGPAILQFTPDGRIDLGFQTVTPEARHKVICERS